MSQQPQQNGTGQQQQPEPEVVPKAKRRTFSLAYKRQILEEAANVGNMFHDCVMFGLLRHEFTVV